LRTVDLGAMPVTTKTSAGTLSRNGTVSGPNGMASFNYPSDLAIDKNGLVYVAEYDAVRTVSLGASGIVSLFLGTPGGGGAQDGTGGKALFQSPQALALDGSGSLWITDNSAVRTATVPGGVVATNFGVLTMGGYLDMPGTAARFGSYGLQGLVAAGG